MSLFEFDLFFRFNVLMNVQLYSTSFHDVSDSEQIGST